MKKFLLTFVILYSISGFSQALNDYKYAILPSKFSFFKNTDQYKLNSITKLYLENYGFTVFFDTDVLPSELYDKSCSKLFVDAVEESAAFTTKIKIVFKDCKNIVLFASASGLSKEKDFELSFKEAFRMALKSIASANYKFQEKKESAPVF